MKTTIVSLALIASTLAAAAHAGVVVRERSDRTESTAGLRRVAVENARGSVHVRPSPDGKLHVAAIKVCRAESDARVRRYARETGVQAGREADAYILRVTYPRKVELKVSFWDLFRDETWENGGLLPRVEVQLVLDVPPGVDVHVTTTSGEVDVEGMTSAMVLRTTSGDVGVRRTRGPLRVETTSGDVDASDVARAQLSTASGDVFVNGAAGPVRVSTASGDLTVNGARDSLSLQASSGDLQVEDSPRTLDARTSSGEIFVQSAAGAVRVAASSGGVRMRLRGPLRSAEVSTGSGSVQLELASGMDADLRAGTRTGEIDSRLNLGEATTGRGELAGRLGRGGAAVRIETSSGDITLTGGGK